MKNLSDLNKALFNQLDKLSKDDFDVDKETKRTDAIVKVSTQIINNAALLLKAYEAEKEKPTLFHCPVQTVDEVLKEIEERNKEPYEISGKKKEL